MCESSDAKIIIRHYFIPSIIPILLVNFTISISEIILMLSAFSYLGLSVGKGVPEWGAMLSNAKQYIYSYPQFILYPDYAPALCDGVQPAWEALRDIVTHEDKL